MLGKALSAALVLLVASFAFSVNYCPGSPQAPACIASTPYEVNAFIFVGSLVAVPILAVALVVQTRRRKRNPPLAGYEPSVPVPDWGPMYVYWLADRLERIGYSSQRNVEVPGLPYRLTFLASRSRKTFLRRSTHFVGAIYQSSTSKEGAEGLFARTEEMCIASARKGKSSLTAPACFVVALLVADNVDARVRDWVRETKPRRHWGALGSLVLVPTDDRKIYYCRKTPIWGGVLYSAFVNSVERILQMKS